MLKKQSKEEIRQFLQQHVQTKHLIKKKSPDLIKQQSPRLKSKKRVTALRQTYRSLNFTVTDDRMDSSHLESLLNDSNRRNWNLNSQSWTNATNSKEDVRDHRKREMLLSPKSKRMASKSFKNAVRNAPTLPTIDKQQKFD